MSFTSKGTPRRRCPRPGKFSKVKKHKCLWYRGLEPGRRRELWERFDYDREKYMLSYQPDDEDFIFFQEFGMQAFVRMERRILRWSRLDPYSDAGKRAIRSLGASLAGKTPDTERPKTVLVSIDFEGNLWDPKYGMSEFGFAKISSRQLLEQPDSSIAALNFALRNKRPGKFRFGNTTSLSIENLGSTVHDLFADTIRDEPGSHIILIGHSHLTEIQILDHIEAPLETLPIAGIIDTCRLAKDVLDSKGSLGSLLTTLRIPHHTDLLHCAGNDVHYTLQALLAIIQTQYHDSAERLERVARRNYSYERMEKAHGHWADRFELDTCFFDCEEDIEPDEGYDSTMQGDEPAEVVSIEGDG